MGSRVLLPRPAAKTTFCAASVQDVAAKAGDVDSAFRLQEEMVRMGVAPNPAVSSTLVGICAREGAPQRARSVFRAMHEADVRPTASAVNALVAAHARSGDLEGAFCALAELPAAGLAPDGTTFATLISACARRGDMDRATLVFSRMRDAGVEPPAASYCAIISSYAIKGKVALGLEWLQRLEASGGRMDASTGRLLQAAAARCGTASDAWTVWRSSRDAALPPSDQALSSILSVILRQLQSLEAAAAAEGPDGPTRQERAVWERSALTAYSEATGAGLEPRMDAISILLACLRQPQPRSVRSTIAAGAQHLSPATNAALSAAHYSSAALSASTLFPTRALALYEEAQALQLVPRFTFGAPLVVDTLPMCPVTAEVCILTLLRVLRRRKTASGDSQRLQPVRRYICDLYQFYDETNRK